LIFGRPPNTSTDSVALPVGIAELMSFVNNHNVPGNFFDIFGMVDILTKGGPLDATNVMIYNLYRDAFEYYKTGLASAQSVVLFLLVVGLTLVQFRTSGRQVHYGG